MDFGVEYSDRLLGATAMGDGAQRLDGEVLRGRNLPLEQSLGVLTDAVNLRLPRHLDRLPGTGGRAHHIIVPAFHNGEPKLYTIDLLRPRGSNAYAFRYTRIVSRQVRGEQMTPRFATAGTGTTHLPGDKRWARDILRDILRLIKAHDAGRIKPQPVAAAFAKLNHRISEFEPTVGRRCIVVWRFQKGGGAHECFDGGQREMSTPCLATNANGMEVSALLKVAMPFMMARLDPSRGGAMEIDEQALNATLAELPDTPDDRLA